MSGLCTGTGRSPVLTAVKQEYEEEHSQRETTEKPAEALVRGVCSLVMKTDVGRAAGRDGDPGADRKL